MIKARYPAFEVPPAQARERKGLAAPHGRYAGRIDGSCAGSFGKIAVRLCRGGGRAPEPWWCRRLGRLYASCPIAAIGICPVAAQGDPSVADGLSVPISHLIFSNLKSWLRRLPSTALARSTFQAYPQRVTFSGSIAVFYPVQCVPVIGWGSRAGGGSEVMTGCTPVSWQHPKCNGESLASIQ